MNTPKPLDNSSFHAQAAKAVELITDLHDDAVRSPSTEKVSTLVYLAKVACRLWSKAPLAAERTLDQIDSSEDDLPKPTSDWQEFSEHLKKVASINATWPTEISIWKGLGFTFTRSKERPSELDQFVEDIGLGKGTLAKPTAPDRRKGTILMDEGKLTFPGLVVAHVEGLKIAFGRPEGPTPETLDLWSRVIIDTLKERDGVQNIRDSADVARLLEPSYRTWSQQNGGGDFETYARHRVHLELKKLLS